MNMSVTAADTVGTLEIQQRSLTWSGGMKVKSHIKRIGRYFRHPQGDPRVNIQKAKNGQAKPYQVRQVLSAAEKMKEETNGGE
jgi:hypothetical protein